MNTRTVFAGTALLTVGTVLFLYSSMITTRPPLLAASIVGAASLVGAIMLGSAADGRSV